MATRQEEKAAYKKLKESAAVGDRVATLDWEMWINRPSMPPGPLYRVYIAAEEDESTLITTRHLDPMLAVDEAIYLAKNRRSRDDSPVS